MKALLDHVRGNRPLLVAIQIAFVAILLAFLTWALRDAWAEAAPRLREASFTDLGIACALLAAYYLVFVFGWQWILAAMGIRVSYGVALQAEMASMLAKYVPGGVWTPAARVVWLRKAGGVVDTPLVVSSILLEAGLSAIAGVLVFLVGLLWVDGVRAPLVPLLAFTVVVAALLHPRLFVSVSGRLFRPFGGAEPPALRWRTMLGLLVYYAASWLVGGAAFLFLLRAVGGEVAWTAIPFLAGTAAVGAIVAVLSIVAPSGLGVREGSMYGLLLALVSGGVALGAVVLNRLAITVVEAALLGLGVAVWRLTGRGTRAPEAAATPTAR